ncbi:MAG: hypothetical protein M1838_004454 [Thelocarpon superellum]|nr:MAG: hypothetical protein M1838_004454 [Thelocarpon superellum]
MSSAKPRPSAASPGPSSLVKALTAGKSHGPHAGEGGKVPSQPRINPASAVSTTASGSSSGDLEGRQMMLGAFRADLENLRSKVTCSICVKLLYEPYTLHCGHTFCYTCLCQWFQANKANKTCPGCRTAIDAQPAPAYLVRDMVEIIINRAELMAPGETAEEHQRWRREEADCVERDKTSRTSGLFRGCFPARGPFRALRDDEDGVDRCPECTWELSDGYCHQCEMTFDEEGRLLFRGPDGDGDFSDMADDSDDIDSIEIENDLDEHSHRLEAFGAEVRRMHAASTLDLEAIDDDDSMDDGDFGTGAFHDDLVSLSHRRRPARAGGNTLGVTGLDTMDDDSENEDDGESESDEEETESMIDFINDSESDKENYRRHTRARAGSVSRHLPSRSSSPSSSSDGDDAAADIDDEYDEGGDVSSGRPRRTASQTSPSTRRRRPRGEGQLLSSASAGLPPADEVQVLREYGWSPLPQEVVEADGESDTTDAVDERGRSRGSLTPTRDRPNPRSSGRGWARRGGYPAARGQSHHAPSRRRDRWTGLTAVGEAADADDASVSPEHDGDVEMDGAHAPARGEKRGGNSVHDAIDLEAGSTSDASIRGPGRRRPRRERQQDYDPRISMMFAEHQTWMRDMNERFPTASLDHLRTLARDRTPATSGPASLPAPPRPSVGARHRARPHGRPATSTAASPSSSYGSSSTSRRPGPAPRSNVSRAYATLGHHSASRGMPSVLPMFLLALLRLT